MKYKPQTIPQTTLKRLIIPTFEEVTYMKKVNLIKLNPLFP